MALASPGIGNKEKIETLRASYDKLVKDWDVLVNKLVKSVDSQTVKENVMPQYGCIRWALCEPLTPPCDDFSCGNLKDILK